jgi:hypothetical protein
MGERRIPTREAGRPAQQAQQHREHWGENDQAGPRTLRTSATRINQILPGSGSSANPIVLF